MSRVAPVVAFLASLVFLVVVWLAYPWVFGDTPFVLDGSNALLTCLHHHDYNACGYTGELNYWGLMSPIGDWPLLQYIPDLIAIGFGASAHATRTRVLEVLNVAAVVAMVVVARVVFVRIGRRSLFWAFMVVVLASPILWYARTTSGEVLAAGILVCLVGAAVVPAHPVLLAAAAAAGCVTKETSYAFVAAFAGLGLALARRRTGRPIRMHLIAAAAGVVVGVVAASVFNVVRFGSVLNKNYLDSHLRTPGLGRKLEYAVGVFGAPNGGILEFWPVATLLLVVAIVMPLLRRRDVWPGVVLAVCTLALLVGFGSWWTPFGWFGFGPRLMVPWVPPLVLMALVAYADELESWLRRLLDPPWRLVLVFAVVLALTLPAVGHMWRPNAISGFFMQQNPTCQAPWRAGNDAWYGCQHRQMWLDKPMQLYALHGLRSASGAVTAAVVALGLAGCFLAARTSRRGRMPARPEARSADPRTVRAR